MSADRVNYAVAQLRHLYQQMVTGQVKNTELAARGLLGPSLADIEAALGVPVDLATIKMGAQTWRHVDFEVRWWEEGKPRRKSFGGDENGAMEFLNDLKNNPNRRHAELFKTEALNR